MSPGTGCNVEVILGCKVGFRVMDYLCIDELRALRMVSKTISKMTTRYMVEYRFRWKLFDVELYRSSTTIPKDLLVEVLVGHGGGDVDEASSEKIEEEEDYFVLNCSALKAVFAECFNKVIHFAPECVVTHLTFGIQFDSTIDNLPKTITHLTFGPKCRFNQPIDNLPNSITHIAFHWHSSFNQPIDHLPNSLQELLFRGQFNQPMDHLPNSVKSIQIDSCSLLKQPLHHLPTSLESFRCVPHLHCTLKHLTSLKVAEIRQLVELPSCLQRLVLRDALPESWPPLLTHLMIPLNQYGNLGELPSTVTFLSTGSYGLPYMTRKFPQVKVLILLLDSYVIDNRQLVLITKTFPSVETLIIANYYAAFEDDFPNCPIPYRRLLLPEGSLAKLSKRGRKKLEEQKIEIRILLKHQSLGLFASSASTFVDMVYLPLTRRPLPHDFNPELKPL